MKIVVLVVGFIGMMLMIGGGLFSKHFKTFSVLTKMVKGTATKQERQEFIERLICTIIGLGLVVVVFLIKP